MEEITFDYFQENLEYIMDVLENEERGYFVMTPDGNRIMLLPRNQSEELKALIEDMKRTGAIKKFE